MVSDNDKKITQIKERKMPTISDNVQQEHLENRNVLDVKEEWGYEEQTMTVELLIPNICWN